MARQKKKAKIIVVLPAYNAAKTLKKTVAGLPARLIKEIILVDDASSDDTVKIAKKLELTVIVHLKNLGYGGNQKTCYQEALKRNPDVVAMIHPDYQYDPTKLKELIEPIIQGKYDFMFGSRIRSRKEALGGGMPLEKYIFNRFYTLIANIVLDRNLSEHMSGMRAYSGKLLRSMPFKNFSNDFVFDQQFIIVSVIKGWRIGEIPIPVKYFDKASSIKFWPGLKFELASFWTLFLYILYKIGWYQAKIFL